MSNLAEYNRLLQCLTVAERKLNGIWHDLCDLEEFGICDAFSDTPEYDRCLEKIEELTTAITKLEKQEMSKVCELPPVISSIVALYM